MSYNPTIILDEMRMVRGVKVSIGFKTYDNDGRLTRITARIRCNRGSLIAKDLAESFGGGGHPYASGIKWQGNNLDLEDIKTQVIQKATELIKAESTI